MSNRRRFVYACKRDDEKNINRYMNYKAGLYQGFLHLVRNGNIKFVRLMLEKFPERINVKRNGYEPIYVALLHMQTDILKLLTHDIRYFDLEFANKIFHGVLSNKLYYLLDKFPISYFTTQGSFLPCMAMAKDYYLDVINYMIERIKTFMRDDYHEILSLFLNLILYYTIVNKSTIAYRFTLNQIKKYHFGLSGITNTAYDAAIHMCDVEILNELLCYSKSKTPLMNEASWLNMLLTDNIAVFECIMKHDIELQAERAQQNERRQRTMNPPMQIEEDIHSSRRTLRWCYPTVIYGSIKIFSKILELFGTTYSAQEHQHIINYIMQFTPITDMELDMRDTDFDVKIERYTYYFQRNEDGQQLLTTSPASNIKFFDETDASKIKFEDSKELDSLKYTVSKLQLEKEAKKARNRNHTLPKILQILLAFIQFIHEKIGLMFWCNTNSYIAAIDLRRHYLLKYMFAQFNKECANFAYEMIFSKPSNPTSESIMRQVETLQLRQSNVISVDSLKNIHRIIFEIQSDWIRENYEYILDTTTNLYDMPSAISVIIDMLPKSSSLIYMNGIYYLIQNAIKSRSFESARILLGYKMNLQKHQNEEFYLTGKSYLQIVLSMMSECDVHNVLTHEDKQSYAGYITSLRVKYHMMRSRMLKYPNMDTYLVDKVFSFL